MRWGGAAARVVRRAETLLSAHLIFSLATNIGYCAAAGEIVAHKGVGR